MKMEQSGWLKVLFLIAGWLGSGTVVHAFSFDDFLKKTACESALYPTFDEMVKRKSLIAKNQGMLFYHCGNQAPAAHLCPTFLELISLDAARLRVKLAQDPLFWANVLEIDKTFALSRAGKSPEEAKYAVLIGVIQQRNQEVDQAIASGRPVDTVFIGDSLMHIFEAYGTVEFPKGLFVGIGGDRTDSLLYRLRYHVGKIKPKNVVISISGNDVLQSCKDSRIQDRRKMIAQSLRALGVKNIYWVSLPPLGSEKITLRMPPQNAKIQSLWTLGVHYVDTYTSMVGPKKMIKPEYAGENGDWIHFNERAYREVWIPQLKALGL